MDPDTEVVIKRAVFENVFDVLHTSPPPRPLAQDQFYPAQYPGAFQCCQDPRDPADSGKYTTAHSVLAPPPNTQPQSATAAPPEQSSPSSLGGLVEARSSDGAMYLKRAEPYSVLVTLRAGAKAIQRRKEAAHAQVLKGMLPSRRPIPNGHKRSVFKEKHFIRKNKFLFARSFIHPILPTYSFHEVSALMSALWNDKDNCNASDYFTYLGSCTALRPDEIDELSTGISVTDAGNRRDCQQPFADLAQDLVTKHEQSQPPTGQNVQNAKCNAARPSRRRKNRT